jgi:hypothetical protein
VNRIRVLSTNTAGANQSPETPPKVAAPPASGPVLFHYAECTNCHNLLPISTNTEKYFAILSKSLSSPLGLGERCARCGADSWLLIKG